MQLSRAGPIQPWDPTVRKTPAINALYYGDNLAILRDYVEDESVDLVYLDPPFNSSATYNVLFRSPTGEGSQAQIEAFEDTWHWNASARGGVRRGDEVGQFRRRRNAARHAVVPEGERHDGVPRHDGGAALGIASRAETDRIALSTLRSDGQSLFENFARCDF
jgi:hypothetical protein